MATRSNKSRIIIWTIVGILVVVAAIFLIVGRKGGPLTGARDISTEDVPGFVSRMEQRLEKFETKVARDQEGYGPEMADAFVQVLELTGKVRTALGDLQGMTDSKEIADKMEEAKKDMAAARQMLRDLTE